MGRIAANPPSKKGGERFPETVTQVKTSNVPIGQTWAMNERPLMESGREKSTVTVDVREDIRNGREPFLRVMKAVSELRSDEQLLLVAPFQPIPLFHVMERRGFAHRGGVAASGDWEILFTRQTNARPEKAVTAITSDPSLAGAASNPAQIVEVDARGLEPPQPLVKVLEAVSTLPANAALRALTDRRPLHLYPQLEDRGFTAVTEEQTDGSFSTYVSRR